MLGCWRDSLVSNVLAMRAQGPEMDPQNLYKIIQMWSGLVIPQAGEVETGGPLVLGGHPA